MNRKLLLVALAAVALTIASVRQDRLPDHQLAESQALASGTSDGANNESLVTPSVPVDGRVINGANNRVAHQLKSAGPQPEDKASKDGAQALGARRAVNDLADYRAPDIFSSREAAVPVRARTAAKVEAIDPRALELPTTLSYLGLLTENGQQVAMATQGNDSLLLKVGDSPQAGFTVKAMTADALVLVRAFDQLEITVTRGLAK